MILLKKTKTKPGRCTVHVGHSKKDSRNCPSPSYPRAVFYSCLCKSWLSSFRKVPTKYCPFSTVRDKYIPCLCFLSCWWDVSISNSLYK